MGTIIAIFTLVVGFIIVLIKAVGSGAKATYDYTTKHVTPPVTWVKEKAIEAKEATSNSSPVAAVKNRADKAEQAARLFIEAVRNLND